MVFIPCPPGERQAVAPRRPSPSSIAGNEVNGNTKGQL